VRALGLILILTLAGCGANEVDSDFVARLGNETLSREELSRALLGLTPGMDSTDAARHMVEQWMTNELLVAEARRRGIDREPSVRANLLKAQSSVLVSALLEQLYDNSDDGPTDQAIQAYFERNRERFRLVAPYVQVRYLVTNAPERAQEARGQMARTDTSDAAAWDALVLEFSTEPDLSASLARSLVPEARAFSEYPAVARTLGSLAIGRTSPVIPERGRYHVLQVLRRIPTGTLPQRAWIEESLRLQLQIESRKLLYARLVQRLRNEALAREQLETP
jgi:PPIC-type PPIASE domain